MRVRRLTADSRGKLRCGANARKGRRCRRPFCEWVLCGLELDLRPQDERAVWCCLSEWAEETNTRIEWVGIGSSRIVVVEHVLSLGAQDQTAALQVKV
jgi:hypothetical protein